MTDRKHTYSVQQALWDLRDCRSEPGSIWDKAAIKVDAHLKSVLAAIINRAAADNPALAYVSIRQLALDLMLGDRTVSRRIKMLGSDGLGLIAYDRRFNNSNVYRVNVKAIHEDAERQNAARKVEKIESVIARFEKCADWEVVLVAPDDTDATVPAAAAKPIATPAATPAPGVADALGKLSITLTAADVTSVAKQLAKYGAIMPVLAIARLTPDQLGRLKTAKSPAALLTTILTAEIEKRQASLSPQPPDEVMAAWRRGSAEPEVAGLISSAMEHGAEELCFDRDSDPRLLDAYLDIAHKLGEGRVRLTGPMWSPDKAAHPIIIRADRIDAALIDDEEEFNPADFADDTPELPDLRCVQAEEFFS